MSDWLLYRKQLKKAMRNISRRNKGKLSRREQKNRSRRGMKRNDKKKSLKKSLKLENVVRLIVNYKIELPSYGMASSGIAILC